MDALLWKADWPEARAALTAWFEHKGLALAVTAPKDEPWERLTPPAPAVALTARWLDVGAWTQRTLYNLSRTYFGGAAFPNFDTNIGGPGSLGLFLGAVGHPAPDTMWYEPVITDPVTHPPLRFDAGNAWWRRHGALLEEALRQARGRYLVGYPDLIENLDTLAQLRDPQLLLTDLIERPDWVQREVADINEAYFAAYDRLWPLLRDPWGGSVFCAFGLWAPGKVAKVQCDFSCMISAPMFREFVVPALRQQCAWLDWSMYHLDGTNALHQLDTLLELDELDAIEWTPQAGLAGGGSARWYDLYRRIKAAGKSVQAIGVQPAEVEPLLDAVGPEGMYIMCGAPDESSARTLLCRCGWKSSA